MSKKHFRLLGTMITSFWPHIVVSKILYHDSVLFCYFDLILLVFFSRLPGPLLVSFPQAFALQIWREKLRDKMQGESLNSDLYCQNVGSSVFPDARMMSFFVWTSSALYDEWKYRILLRLGGNHPQPSSPWFSTKNITSKYRNYTSEVVICVRRPISVI